MAKTIVFCVDSEHADQMRQRSHRRERRPHSAVPALRGSHRLRRGRRREGAPRQLRRLEIGDAGDRHDVEASLDRRRSSDGEEHRALQPVGSMVEFKQIIGRGTRLYPDADKLSFEIIDYSGRDGALRGSGVRRTAGARRRRGDRRRGRGRRADGGSRTRARIRRERGDEVDADELEAKGGGKLYVDESDVWITAEGFYLPDSGESRGSSSSSITPTTSPVHVGRLFAEPPASCAAVAQTGGRGRWRSLRRPPRDLRCRIEELAERVGPPEADPLDLLVFVAWNGPAVSRRDRANRVGPRGAAFLEGFASGGAGDSRASCSRSTPSTGSVSSMTLECFEVPPLPQFGTPVEIAGRFGAPEALREAVERLERASLLDVILYGNLSFACR